MTIFCTKITNFFGRNDAKAETPVLWPPHAKSWLIGKDPDAGRDWGQEENGMREDEMAGWHHRLDGRESEWTLEVGDGQGGLACCDSLGHKESDTTELLTWTELNDDYEFGWVISNGWYYPPEDKLLSPTWHQSIRSLLTMFPFWIHFFFSLPHEDRHSVFIS